MKRFRIIIVFIFVSVSILATTQAPDRLLYKERKLGIRCPLINYFQEKGIDAKELFGSDNTCWTTAHWKGYSSTWEIGEDSTLYLLRIEQPCGFEDGKVFSETLGRKYADLKKLFPQYYKDGKVSADWITTELIAGENHLFSSFYGHIAYMTEYAMTIHKGKLTQVERFDNSKSRLTRLSDSYLSKYIQNEINYEALPDSGKRVSVIVHIKEVDDNGRITDVEVLRGYGDAYDREAIRVTKAIPDWTVIYHKGKAIAVPDMLPIYFDPSRKASRQKKALQRALQFGIFSDF